MYMIIIFSFYQVTFDDVTISVKLNNGKTVELASDPGVTLTLVDTEKKLPLDKTTFESGDDFQVKAELEGVQGMASSTCYVVAVEVSVAAVPGYEQKNFTAGEALPELSLDDFIVDYKLGSTWYRADDSVDVELFYSTNSKEYDEIEDETKLSENNVYVYASVNGVISTVEKESEAPCAGLVGKAAVPATVESIDVAVATGFAYPAKMAEYNTVPTISASDVVVTATYSGASSDVITSTIAAPVELQLNGIEDMLYMYSESKNGSYKLTLFFEVGSDPDMALVNVQNQLQLVTPRLPEEVKRYGLTVRKSTGGAGCLLMSLSSPNGTYDSLFLANYATMFIKDELARIKGCGQVQIFGAGD